MPLSRHYVVMGRESKGRGKSEDLPINRSCECCVEQQEDFINWG